jgi:hypothetical protein
MLIKQAYRIEEIRQMITKAGCAEPQVEVSPVGFELGVLDSRESSLLAVTTIWRNFCLSKDVAPFRGFDKRF